LLVVQSVPSPFSSIFGAGALILVCCTQFALQIKTLFASTSLSRSPCII